MSNKERMAVWLYPETKELIEKHMKDDNCRSSSEYIERAVKFYTGYLDSSTDVSTAYLSQIIKSVIEGVIGGTEHRLSRILFKLAVEVGAATHLSAAMSDVDEETLDKLRAMCVKEIKETNGVINFERAVRFQRSDR